jgi:hypothetical protein
MSDKTNIDDELIFQTKKLYLARLKLQEAIIEAQMPRLVYPKANENDSNDPKFPKDWGKVV